MRRADWTPTTPFSPMFNVVDDPLLAKLDDLANLPKGWEFGRGVPVRPEVIRTAQEIYGHFNAKFHLEADAFPWANGSLSLAFYAGNMCVEINIYGDTYDVDVEKGKGPNFGEVKHIPDASMEDVNNEIIHIVLESAWHLSESSIQDTTINGDTDSPVAASPIPTKAEFQLSTFNVPENALGPYANT